jgi:DnaD/phage-associated family protein
MVYKLPLGIWADAITVPRIVADNLADISGNVLKAILYLLANGGAVEMSDIAESIGVSEADLQYAVQFFEDTGANNYFADFEKQAELIAKKITLRRDVSQSPETIAETLEQQPMFAFLFAECEKLFGKNFNHTMQKTLVTLTDEIGMQPDCVLALIKYHIADGTGTSPSLWKKTALDWVYNGITNIDKITAETARLLTGSKLENEVKKRFNADKFSVKQREFIREWSNAGYSIDIINAAGEISLDKKTKYEFGYINGILKKWKEKGVKTLDDIARLGSAARKAYAKANAPEPKQLSFDLDKF